MTQMRDFDRMARAWLDLMPDEAPDRVIDAVLQAVDRLPQRRTPIDAALGRFLPMNRLSLAAAAVAIVLLVGGGALVLSRFSTPQVGGASPSAPAQTPSPTSLRFEGTYTSPLYGYSVTLPQGFLVRTATNRLVGHQIPHPEDFSADQVSQDPFGGGANVLIGAAALQPGETLSGWTAGTVSSWCGKPTTYEDITVDGEPGKLSTYANCLGFFHLWVSVVHDGQGWTIVWFRTSAPGTGDQDRAIFFPMLASFKFGTGAVTPPASAAATNEPFPADLLGAWHQSSRVSAESDS